MKFCILVILFSFINCTVPDLHCHFTCKSCSVSFDSKACTACHHSANLVDGKCACPAGLGMTKDGECELCHSTCEECLLADRPFHCTSCKDPSAVITPVFFACIMIFPPPPECDSFGGTSGQCVCQTGYAFDEIGMCKKCPHKNCNKCGEHGHPIATSYGEICQCDTGYSYNSKDDTCIEE